MLIHAVQYTCMKRELRIEEARKKKKMEKKQVKVNFPSIPFQEKNTTTNNAENVHICITSANLEEVLYQIFGGVSKTQD